MGLRIIQIQVCETTKIETFNGFEKDVIVKVLYGLGLDGIVYIYDVDNKHWTPITTNRVNPLHKQPAKKLRNQIEGKEDEKHETH